jgi:hypothetical protein
MPHRGGRKGRPADVAAQNDHLCAERLADIVDRLGTSPESTTKRPFRPDPLQPAVDEPSGAASARPQAPPREKREGPVPTVTAPAPERQVAERQVAEPLVAEPLVAERRVTEPLVTEPAAPEPAVALPAVAQWADTDPAVDSVPEVSMPAASKRGRHRAPASPRLVVRGFGLTSLRIALMGAVAVLVVVAAALLIWS